MTNPSRVNDFYELVQMAAISGGLDPTDPNDLYLLMIEVLDDPAITVFEAAKRAFQKKARLSNKSGFDRLYELLNDVECINCNLPPSHHGDDFNE